MKIEITDEDLEQIKELVKQYKYYYGDESYFYHLADFLIELMVKNGIIKKEDLPI